MFDNISLPIAEKILQKQRNTQTISDPLPTPTSDTSGSWGGSKSASPPANITAKRSAANYPGWIIWITMNNYIGSIGGLLTQPGDFIWFHKGESNFLAKLVDEMLLKRVLCPMKRPRVSSGHKYLRLTPFWWSLEPSIPGAAEALCVFVLRDVLEYTPYSSKHPLRLYLLPFFGGPNFTFQRVYGAPTEIMMWCNEICALPSSGYPKLKGKRCTSPGSWKSLSIAGLIGTSCKTKLKFSCAWWDGKTMWNIHQTLRVTMCMYAKQNVSLVSQKESSTCSSLFQLRCEVLDVWQSLWSIANFHRYPILATSNIGYAACNFVFWRFKGINEVQ